MKLVSDHNTFAKIKNDEAKLANLLSKLPGAVDIVPADLRRDKPGQRRWFSVFIVVAAAMAAIGFCLAVLAAK